MERISSINGQLHTTGDAIVAGDFHIPQQDDIMVESICDFGRDFGIEMLIINGDFCNSDVFSEFKRKQTNAGWQVEKAACRKVMSKFQSAFKYIVWILGNHDNRIMRVTNYSVTFDDLARILVDNYDPKQIYLTDWDHIIHDDWRICHPHEYSRKPCFKAKQFGEKYNCNTIVGHSHMLNMMAKRTGKTVRYYIDGGCCCDNDLVEYEIMNTTSFSRWTPGFVLLRNNKPELITPNKAKLITAERKEFY